MCVSAPHPVVAFELQLVFVMCLLLGFFGVCEEQFSNKMRELAVARADESNETEHSHKGHLGICASSSLCL